MSANQNWGIRLGEMTDFDDILALERLCFTGDRLSSRSLRRLLKSPTAKFFIATKLPERLAGGCALLLSRRDSSRFRIYSLAVSPAFRGIGLGALLLGAAEAAARSNGGRSIGFEARRGNGAAIALYEKAGYLAVGERPDYYEDGAAAILYRKEL